MSIFILKLNATFNLQKTLFLELLATFCMAIKIGEKTKSMRMMTLQC